MTSLHARVRETTETALASRALRPIATREELLVHRGVTYLMRTLNQQPSRDKAKAAQNARGKDFNPFLPYEGALFVEETPPCHVVLLNKFNVVDHHLILITRHFEDQEDLLTADDFLSLAHLYKAYNGLSFYNGGVDAGASQRHKHLQMVPLPLVAGDCPVPVEMLLRPGENGRCNRLAFDHRVHWFPNQDAPIPAMAQEMTAAYKHMMTELELWRDDGRQGGAYNLIGTQRWMMVIPRTTEIWRGIAVNALGFAGTFLVRNQAAADLLREVGPQALLKAVGKANPNYTG